MKKISKILTLVLVATIMTGCGCSKKTTSANDENLNTDEGINENSSVLKDQIFEGLEFVNTSAQNGEIETVVINNTGVVYEGSDFKMIVKDSSGNVIVELTDTVTEPMDIGTTKTIITKTTADLSKAAVIQYSIVNK